MTKNIVITGSTRGIGYGLADAFLARECSLTISGRTQAGVDSAVAKLSEKHGSDCVHGCPCDVRQLAQVEGLWESAVARFGEIDIWINNAGIGHDLVPMWEVPPERVVAIVDTNVTGMIYGSRVAVRGMIAQGYGQLYNMQGFGSGGQVREGLSVYGASKAAVNSLSSALIAETENTPVRVGMLSPGMVVTDMILDPLRNDPEALERSRRIFNILCDQVETVAPWLAERVLANDAHGARIKWLTRPKIAWRFLTAPFVKRDVFGEHLD